MEKMPGYSPEYVTAIYELYGKYHFNQDEIRLIRKGVSITSILSERISGILQNTDSVITYETIENTLKENKAEIINILEKYKEDLSSDKYDANTITNINDTIDIIEKMEEIINKYEGKFSKVKRYINGEPFVDIETYNKAVQSFKKNNICNT